MPVHQSQLAAAQRQIAIRPHAALVDQHAAGAVHGLDGEIGVVDHRGVHVFAVMIPVAAAFPQAAVEHDGGLDLLIPGLAMDLAPVVLQDVAQNHALGIEEREARALVADVKQVQLAAQLAVVALFGLLDAVQVLLELLLGGESGCVDSAEHLVMLIAAPVGARHVGELKRLDIAQIRQVRTHAQVGEVAHLVEGQHLILGQILDQLDLVGLLTALHVGDGLGTGQRVAARTDALFSAALHFLFDLGKVLHGEGNLGIKVIVKAVRDGGADGQLRLGEQVLDGHGHQVAGRMEEHLAAVRVVEGERGHGLGMGNGAEQVAKRAVLQPHDQVLFPVIGHLRLEQVAHGGVLRHLVGLVKQVQNHGLRTPFCIYGDGKRPPPHAVCGGGR